MNNFFYSPSKKRSLFLLFFVLVLVAFVFFPVVKAEFLYWNDYDYLVNNKQVQSLGYDNIKGIFQFNKGERYFPLTILSWAVEYRFIKLNPLFYHLNNLLLHFCVVGLIYALARKIGLSILAAGFTSLLFGIHPLHVGSVVWVSQRRDLLYSFFYMLSIYVYMTHCQQYVLSRVKSTIKYNRYLIGATILGGMSFLASSMALSLPLIFVLFDWFRGRPLNRRVFIEKLPLVVMIISILYMSVNLSMDGFMDDVWSAFLIWPWTFIFYIKQFVWPLLVLPFYRVPTPVSFMNFEYLSSYGSFIVIIGASFYFRRYKWFVFAILFYILSIFFVLRFDTMQDFDVVLDRYMYMPSLGICFLLGYAFDRLVNRGRASRTIFFKVLPWICILTIYCLFGFKAYSQVGVWKNNETVWKYHLKYSPREYIALNNLALSLIESPQYKESFKLYKKIRSLGIKPEEVGDVDKFSNIIKRIDYVESLLKRSNDINPEQVDTLYSLGYFYETLGLYDEALLHYILATEIVPSYKDLYLRIGSLYGNKGDHAKVIQSYEKMLSIRRDEWSYINVILAYKEAILSFSDEGAYKESLRRTLDKYIVLINNKGEESKASYYNLGFVYEMLGIYDQAIQVYSIVLGDNPNNIEAIFRSGLIHQKLNQLEKALSLYDRALIIDARRMDIVLEKGNIFVKQGKYRDAVKLYRKILMFDSEDVEVLFILGRLYEKLGRIKESRRVYERYVRLDEDNVEVFYSLGNIYLFLNKYDVAEEFFLKAIKIDSFHKSALVKVMLLNYGKGNFVKAYTYYKEARLLGYDVSDKFLNNFKGRGLIDVE